MLREPASSPNFQPMPKSFEDDSPQQATPLTDIDKMRQLVEPYLSIAHEGHINLHDLPSEDQTIILSNDSDLVMTFSGYLKQEADIVYRELDEALKPHDRFALLREKWSNPDAPHIIHIVDSRLAETSVGSIWINVVLFLLTVFSLMYAGTNIAISQISITDPATADAMSESLMTVLAEIWRGYPYALALLAILIPHEMGHYLMMRRHGLTATLPYFLPAFMISAFGTFGAAIMLKDVLKDRKVLLDVGAAGPIAGFIVAVPLVIYGLATSPVVPFDATDSILWIEGNSLTYAFAKIVALGEIYPTSEADVLINQIAFAGWTGLFVTALNLIPVGQLDGGHVMFSLFGERARWAYIPVMLSLIALSIFAGEFTWLFFLLILFLLGRYYAVPLDAITPLNTTRKAIAWSALGIFVLTFTPIPFYQFDPSTASPTGADVAFYGSVILAVGLLTVPKWLQMRKLSE